MLRCILYPYGAMQVYYSHGSKPKIRDPKSLLCTEGAIHIQAGRSLARRRMPSLMKLPRLPR
jgi:hypothetical protein